MRAAMVRAVGMVSPVGFDAPSSCAAVRCGIAAFKQTSFKVGGQRLTAAAIPFADGVRGRDKLLRMATMAVRECLGTIGTMGTIGTVDGEVASELPVLLCLSEPERPGRFAGLDESFLFDLRARAGLPPEQNGSSEVLAAGRVGGVMALRRARDLLAAGAEACLVVGVDTLLISRTLGHLEDEGRLLREGNTDGFIPGEAAAAVLLVSERQRRPGLQIVGLGLGHEPAFLGSDLPLRADGMVAAIKAAFADGRTGYEDVDYRIADLSGEQHRFKELSLALSRTMRVRKPAFDLWHPSECIGEVGAAIGPFVLGVAADAAERGYAPGSGVIAHFSNDDGARGVVVCRRGEGTA